MKLFDIAASAVGMRVLDLMGILHRRLSISNGKNEF